MKKIWKKVLAGVLAVVMIYTSITFDRDSAAKAEAATDVSQNVVSGEVLADVDFAKTDLSTMDQYFTASQGTGTGVGVTAASVSEYWRTGEEKAVENVTNVAREGTATMDVLTSFGSFSAGQLIDGDVKTMTTTKYHDVADVAENPEIATVTFKDNAYYEISKVQIYWRNEKGCPEDFEVQVFNGSEWETKAKETGYTYTTQIWSADITSAKCNAIRLVATKLRSQEIGGTSNYCLQLNEIEAYGVACTNAAIGGTPSMEVMSWVSAEHPVTCLNDNDRTQWTTTNYETSADVEKTATITFAENAYYEINHVQIFWRDARGCPTEFEIQVQTGEGWKTVATEQNNDTSQKIWSTKIEPIACNAIQLKATKLNPGEPGKEDTYCLMLNEFEAYGVACTNAAIGGTPSMEILLGDHPATFLNDNDRNGWTATRFETSADVEKTATITFAENAYYKISHVQIFWRDRGGSILGSPTEFEIQVQTKEGWKTVATENNYSTSQKIWSTKIEPIECNAIRLKATKLSPGEAGNEKSYCLMLNEFEAWGEKVDYLHTKTTYYSENPTTTLLAWKDTKVENFKAEIEMVYFDSAKTRYGLCFGQSELGTTEGAKIIQPFMGTDKIYGGVMASGVKQNTAEYVKEDAADDLTDGSDSASSGMFADIDSAVYNKMSIKNFPTAIDLGNVQTLNVEVIDGVAKIWWTGFENTAWTVELTDYKGGYISLMSQGNDQGGIRSFRLRAISDDGLQSNVEMSVEPFGDYTIVSVTNDIAGGILKNSKVTGSVTYDTAKFEYCTTVMTDSEGTAIKGEGSVGISFSSCTASAAAKLYFKNIANECDYNGFAVAVDRIERTNGKTVTATKTENILYDYTGAEGTPDKLVDARDLVRAAKDDKTPEVMRSAFVGLGSDLPEGLSVK